MSRLVIIKIVPLFFVLLVLFSCETKTVDKTDAAYKIKTYHYTQDDSLSPYVLIDIHYFQIDSDDIFAQKINALILNEYKESDEDIPNDPNQLLSLYFYMQVGELKAMITEYGETERLPYEIDYDAIVVINNDSLFTFEIRQNSFTGDAHRNRSIAYANYDLKTQKLIKRSDLFSDDEMIVLNKMGESTFRKEHHLDKTKSLAELGYSFDEGFKLPDNFLLKADSIWFYYGGYELGSYSPSEAEFSISYKDIKESLPEAHLFNYVN